MDRLDFSAAADPEAIAAAVLANADQQSTDEFSHGGGHGGVSVRTSVHDGHEIVIRTHYEILVDGEPFDPHVVVDNAGRVHYHGLPTRDFPSLVDLVAKAIDTFPDDFPAPGAAPVDPDGHGHGGHHGAGHGAGHDAGHGVEESER